MSKRVRQHHLGRRLHAEVGINNNGENKIGGRRKSQVQPKIGDFRPIKQ